MCWSITHLVLIFALTVSLAEASSASHYTRDESNEDTNTGFNLAATFKGGITSNRHHDRARLNSQLYPDLRQLPAAGYPYGDIDRASGHESGGRGDLGSGTHPPAYQPVPSSLPPQPGYAYPGQYLPQYPVYMPGYYPGLGPGPIVMPGSLPTVNHPGGVAAYNYAPHPTPEEMDRWNHRYRMQTEYTEDGVHKGPFGVLNNHGGQGYGSGFGSGYNGAFNRPGY